VPQPVPAVRSNPETPVVSPPLPPLAPADAPRTRTALAVTAVLLLAAALGAAALHARQDRPLADGGAGPRADALAVPAPLVVAGSVVDGRTKRALGRVRVELEGGGDTITDDAGNFRLQAPATAPADQRRLVRARKDGYGASELWILPPVEDLILPLAKE